jgi:hypothetical protein
MGKFNLEIEKSRTSYDVKFWLWEEANGADIFYTFNTETNSLWGQSVNKTNTVLPNELRPFLVLPLSIANEFIKLMAEHANNQGITTENESKLIGKLAAKEEHLADFKKILFHTLKLKD